MSDNAMHILLIVISSLVLINSIVWLCLDNIDKDEDKGKGKNKNGGKNEEYESSSRVET